MVNTIEFCKWIKDLDDNQIRKLKDLSGSMPDLINYIRGGFFNGLTFAKENYKEELAMIMRYADLRGFKYSFVDEIITYMNHYNGINHDEYYSELAILHDSGSCTTSTRSRYNIDRVMLSYPDKEYDNLSYNKAEKISDAVILLFMKTNYANKPDKEEFKQFILDKILSDSNEYELQRFATNILGTFIDMNYFLDCLLEVCKENNILHKLFQNEIYRAFHRIGPINDFILNALMESGYDAERINSYIYDMYCGQNVTDFIKEVLPYDIKFIKVLYAIENRYRNSRAISHLSELAYRVHPEECIEKQDEFEYSLPLRQLLILIKSCIKKNIAKGQDSKLLGKVLSGLILLHDYNFDKIINSMYSCKTAIF